MKHIKQQNKRVSPSPKKGAITERGLFRLMLPSLLGILLCSTCLAGLTWAYFSDSVTSSANTITAATFTVDVTITEITETGSAGTAATDTTTVSSPGDVSAEQEENTPSGTPLANASNTAANAEGNTLTANVLSVGTTDPSIYTQTNAEGTPGGGSDPENKAAGEGTTTGEGGTPVKGTPEAGSVLKNEAAGEGTTTGEGGTPAEGTPEAGSVPKNEAAGEGTLAASSLPNMESKTDTPITTTAVERNTDDSYTLHAGKKYTVTLKASGNTKGYCKVTVNENDYYTEKMDPAQELVFSIDCSSMTSETTVRITPGWVNSDYPNIEGEAATNKINNGGSIGTSTTDDNATEQADSPAVAEPSADTDETLRGETGQSNEQTNNGETAGGTTENTTADTNDETTSGSTGETAETTPGESDETTGMSTDGDEEPANEGTDTEKANSEPSADEPTDPPSEGQSE